MSPASPPNFCCEVVVCSVHTSPFRSRKDCDGDGQLTFLVEVSLRKTLNLALLSTSASWTSREYIFSLSLTRERPQIDRGSGRQAPRSRHDRPSTKPDLARNLVEFMNAGSILRLGNLPQNKSSSTQTLCRRDTKYPPCLPQCLVD